MVKVKRGRTKSKSVSKTKTSARGTITMPLATPQFAKIEGDIKNLSEQELRELLMITMYKMALLRSQVETLNNVLIRNKLTTYEEIWKDTNDNFNNTI